MPIDIRCVQADPALPPVDCRSRRPCTCLGMFRTVIHTVADHVFGIMLKGHHKVRKHTVYLPAPRITASMPWNEEHLAFTIIMADDPLTVIPEDKGTLFAHGTKVFTAVR